MHKDADKDLAQSKGEKSHLSKKENSGGEKNHRSKRKRAEAEKKLQREKSHPSNRKCAEAKKKLQRKEKRKERRIAAEKLLQCEDEERDLLFSKRRPWSRTRRTSSSASSPTKSLPSTVLGDLDEMDPLHGRLEGLLDASQFALLATMDQDVRDAEFLSELESDQKGDKAQGVQQEVENKSESKRVQSVLR